MLELGSSGSVRGVSSNGHPYRDPRAWAATAIDTCERPLWVGCGLSTRDIRGSRRLSKPLDFRPKIAVANIFMAL